MNTPAWRIWLTVALVCLWGMLGIRSAQREDWFIAAISAVMFLVNGVTLRRLTRRDK